MLNQKETELAKVFLREYADRLCDDGCNDWDFPEDWSMLERQNFVKQYYAWNGDPENYNPKHLNLPNFAAVSFLAYRMTQKNHDYLIKIKKNQISEKWVLGYLTEAQQEDLSKATENQNGTFHVCFSYSGIGVVVKVYNDDCNLLVDLTDYDSW